MNGSTDVNKLVLVINESCNLRCGYCYARLAPNNRNAGRMTTEAAKIIIRNFFAQFDKCGFIQFFGGEPTLNLDCVEAVIGEILKLIDNGLLKNKPRFGIVTNGVLRESERTIDLLSKYKIETTISLDGPDYIHNELRPLIRGAPTFEKVMETISTVKKNGIPLAIESVYTSFHIKQGYSITDLFQFCQSLGIRKLFFNIAYPPAPSELNPLLDPYFEQLLNYYREAIDWWFHSLTQGDENVLDIYFKELLLPLLKGEPATLAEGGCLAGKNDFAIGPNGDVFACHLFYGYANYLIENAVDSGSQRRMLEIPHNVKDIEACHECYARYWCQPCPALNYFWGNAWVPPVRECIVRKYVLSRIGYWAFGLLEVPDNDITRVLREGVANNDCTMPVNLKF